MMTTDTPWHESFMVRLWAEPDGAQLVLRGSAPNVQTRRTESFNTLDLPVGSIRAAAARPRGWGGAAPWGERAPSGGGGAGVRQRRRGGVPPAE